MMGADKTERSSKAKAIPSNTVRGVAGRSMLTDEETKPSSYNRRLGDAGRGRGESQERRWDGRWDEYQDVFFVCAWPWDRGKGEGMAYMASRERRERESRR